nr:META domain-containing protein [Cryptosporangium phraense]
MRQTRWVVTASDQNSTLVLGPIATTRMACSGPADAVERAVLRAPAQKPLRYGITENHLRIGGPESGLILTP